MQLAGYLEQVPSWNEMATAADPLEDLDTLLASPSMWEFGSMLQEQVENASDHPSVPPALTSSESAAPTASSDKPLTRQQQRGDAREDRKLAMSREVQKRFRQRQKVNKGRSR